MEGALGGLFLEKSAAPVGGESSSVNGLTTWSPSVLAESSLGSDPSSFDETPSCFFLEFTLSLRSEQDCKYMII